MRVVWRKASARLHERVLEGALDSLTGEVAQLHRPTCREGALPTCLGCDSEVSGGPGAVWPCRTYTLIARTVLHVPDVEVVLTALCTEDCG